MESEKKTCTEALSSSYPFAPYVSKFLNGDTFIDLCPQPLVADTLKLTSLI